MKRSKQQLLAALACSTLAAACPTLAQDKVQVFILAGQSNMQGHGWFNDRTPTNGIDELGTLQKLIDNDPNGTYDYLQDANGNYLTRSDVSVFTTDGNRSGALTVGYGVSTTQMGIELGFGWQVGDNLPQDVLLIKTNWGGKSLQTDFRPPSAVRDRGGEVGFYYNQILNEVDNVLNDLGTYVPGYSGQGYELKGLAWHQGWNDRVNGSAVAEYGENIADFIEDIRFDLGAAELPFVIANTGIGGPGENNSNALALMNAQLSVDEFTGTNPIANVRAIDTRQYWRDASQSPITSGNQGFHWNQNGETMFLMGDEMGSVMNTMSDYVQFQQAYLEVNRQSGEIKIVNPIENIAAFNLQGYTINSASGALDADAWQSIAGNYDASGDASVDTGDWTIDAAGNLVLSESAVPGGADGSIAIGSEVSLGPGAWIQNLTTDLNATYIDQNGDIQTLYIVYTGQENIFADLTFDGTIDINDWAVFIENAQTDMAGLSLPESYQLGDLDGDLDNDLRDFSLFRDAFEAANPEPGAFEAMLLEYQAVPEPTSLAMLAGGALILLRRRAQRDRDTQPRQQSEVLS
jgi:hypothetical protein